MPRWFRRATTNRYPTGRVKPGELPAASKVARTVYHGSYEGLGAAWSEPASWRTELNQPLVG